MGEIADDCHNIMESELEEIDNAGGYDMWCEQRYGYVSKPIQHAKDTCNHRFEMGRCPNFGCSGHFNNWKPF